AAWVENVFIFTSSTVLKPPNPWAPIPKSLIRSYRCKRSSSSLVCGPCSSNCSTSKGSDKDSLANNMALSADPPTPMPKIPGGHQPAPIFGTVSNTQSTKESLGFNIAKCALFSEPPPL